jgi:soluble lytic murein transglycosylase-like protein
MLRNFCVLTALGLGMAMSHAGLAAESADSKYHLKLAAPDTYRLQMPGPSTAGLPYDGAAREAAARQHLDVALLHAVMATESGHSAGAVSPAGAIGLMQLMPATAKRFGVSNPRSPSENLNGGAAYLRQLLDRFDQNLELALAAYNAGEGAVEAHGRQIPPYAETRRYVPAVTSRYQALKKVDNPYRLNTASLAGRTMPQAD